MEASLHLRAEPLDEGGYVVTSPDVPGLVAQGRTLAEACEIAQGLARKIAESCVENGDPLPAVLASAAVMPARVVELIVPVAEPGLGPCPSCGSPDITAVVVDVILTVRGNVRTVTAVAHERCNVCRERIFGVEASKRFDQAFGLDAGLGGGRQGGTRRAA